MKTGYEDQTDAKIFNYLNNIKSNDRFDQNKWNLLCLELFKRIMKDRMEFKKPAKYDN